MRRATSRLDTGSAPVDFVLVGALLTVLFAALVQLGLLLYTRNVAASAATEGARYAANADRDCSDGEQWTREELARSVAGTVVDVRCSADGQRGVVAVSVTVRPPVLGLLGHVGTLRLTGHAVDEHAVTR